MNKYRAKRCQIDGIKFDSLAEGRRYSLLKLMQENGHISDLECHPKYDFHIDGQKICTYIADFRYFDKRTHCRTVEDVKGVKTAAFQIKRKLMRAINGIEITIVK